MSKSLLILFAKNPALGNVKSRLAATLGDVKAFAIYHKLLSYTIEITQDLKFDKAVFYSDYVDTEDKWSNSTYQKFTQHGTDLGARMQNAFEKGFELDYSKIVIIGTDNLELTSTVIEASFKLLDKNDCVIGPAKDGGYYLIGMKKLHPKLFENKVWSSSSVLIDTLSDLKSLRISHELLAELNDIDTEEDWIRNKTT